MVIDMNLSTLRSMSVQNESANPLQFTIDLIRADYAMFEAVINVDIAQVMNESGQMVIGESEMNTLLESTGNGIISKIKELITKAKNALVKFFNMIKEKFQSIFDKDEKLIKKYEDKFNEVLNKGLESEPGEFECPDYTALDTLFSTKTLEETKVIDNISKIKNSNEESEAQKIIDDYNKLSKDYIEELDKTSKYITRKNQGKLPSVLKSGYTLILLNNIKSGKSKRIKNVKAYTDSQIKMLDSIRSLLKLGKIELPDDVDENLAKNKIKSVTKYNACFSLINIAQQTVNKVMSMQLHALKKEYSVERKLFMQIVKLGNVKDKKKDEGEESVDEAFVLWAVGERSDIAVEAAFMD